MVPTPGAPFAGVTSPLPAMPVAIAPMPAPLVGPATLPLPALAAAVPVVAAPAVAQTASSASSQSTSHTTNDGEKSGNWVWSDNGKKFEVNYRGDIEFTDDDSDVSRMSPGGYLRIKDGQRFGTDNSVEFRGRQRRRNRAAVLGQRARAAVRPRRPEVAGGGVAEIHQAERHRRQITCRAVHEVGRGRGGPRRDFPDRRQLGQAGLLHRAVQPAGIERRRHPAGAERRPDAKSIRTSSSRRCSSPATGSSAMMPSGARTWRPRDRSVRTSSCAACCRRSSRPAR